MKDGDLTYRVIGCAMSVHSELGPGLNEKPYENALSIELDQQNITHKQQPNFPIFYRKKPVGYCQPDFVIENELVVDTKATARLGDQELAQMLNYLRITKHSIGLLLNFRPKSLEVKRVTL